MQQILEALQTAPSAGNLQKIVVGEEPQTKRKLAAAFRDREVKDASGPGEATCRQPCCWAVPGKRPARRPLQNMVRMMLRKRYFKVIRERSC